MANEKKPVPWCGHNYGRILSAFELWVITKKKHIILARIVKTDEQREEIDKKFNIQNS
ncbi:MAG TPA: hypothetical protein VK805_15185 [Candidatus Baltobacteraceae bacterium]|nr:hypothetical protein [Candidatus Baltobacteraceae bacterium]